MTKGTREGDFALRKRGLCLACIQLQGVWRELRKPVAGRKRFLTFPRGSDRLRLSMDPSPPFDTPEVAGGLTTSPKSIGSLWGIDYGLGKEVSKAKPKSALAPTSSSCTLSWLVRIWENDSKRRIVWATGQNNFSTLWPSTKHSVRTPFPTAKHLANWVCALPCWREEGSQVMVGGG